MCEHCGSSLEEREEEAPVTEKPPAAEEPAAEESLTTEEQVTVEEPSVVEEPAVEEAPAVEPEKAEVEGLRISKFSVIGGALIVIGGLILILLQETDIGIGAAVIGLITFIFGLVKKK